MNTEQSGPVGSGSSEGLGGAAPQPPERMDLRGLLGAMTDDRDRLARRVAQLEGLGGWRPIETSPTDKLVLLYGAKRSEMVVGMKHSRDGWVIDTPAEWASMYPPTHWMPLPEPPNAPAQAARQGSPGATG